jgi:hypothetical protein
MLGRRTRVMAALGGLAFHWGGAIFLRIHFAGLWLCYLALIDWGPIVDRIRSFRDGTSRALPGRGRDQEAPASEVTRARGTQAPVAWVGALLVGAALVQGMRGATFAWPFGCYPTFQWRATTTLPDLELEALFDDGRSVVIDSGGDGRGRPQSGWATVWSLAGIAHAPRSARALRVYWNRVDHAQARGAVRGSVALVTWSVLPEDRSRPPLSKQVIATFALDVQSGAAL